MAWLLSLDALLQPILQLKSLTWSGVITQLQNAEVILLPLIATSFHKPLVHGIFHSWKAHYHRRLVQYIVDEYAENCDPHKIMHVLQALQWGIPKIVCLLLLLTTSFRHGCLDLVIARSQRHRRRNEKRLSTLKLSLRYDTFLKV